MKEALKSNNECVLYKDNKEEKLNKLVNIREILCSEFESGYLSANLFDLIDEISIMIIDKTNYEVGDSLSIFQSNKNQENETVDKLTELRNSTLNVSVERRNVL